jgi:hypothetical protein
MAPPSDRPGIAGRLLAAVRHAFAVEGESGGLSPAQLETADRVAAAVARRGLAVPALMLLETLRPLNYVAAQALHGLTPLAGSLVGDKRFDRRRVPAAGGRRERSGRGPGPGIDVVRTAGELSPCPRSCPSSSA